MNRKNIKTATLYTLFIYIIIFLTTTSTTLNRIGLLFVAGFGMLYFMLNGLKIKSNSFLNCMFFYGVMIFFTKLYSTVPADKFNSAFIAYISMFIVIFVVTLVVEDEKDVEFLLKAFAFSVIVQCIYMLSVYGVGIISAMAESEESIRLGDEVSNSNSVGMSFAIGYLVSLHFFLNEKMPMYKKIFYAILMTIGFVFGLLSGSRKALIILVAGSFASLALKNVGKKNVVKLFFGIIIACVVLVIMYNLISTHPMFAVVNDRFTALVEGLQGEGQLDHSSEERFRMMRVGWDVFKNNPFIGEGLNASYNYFETYSHNNFIEVLMNTGLIGFLIFYFPYFKGTILFLTIEKSKKIYPVMLILFLWIFLGGYGMVTYYSKYSMMLMALVSSWLTIQRRKSDEKIN